MAVKERDGEFYTSISQLPKIIAYISKRGGICEIKKEWDRGNSDFEMLYYLSLLKSFLNENLVSHLKEKALQTENSKNLLYLLKAVEKINFCNYLDESKVTLYNNYINNNLNVIEDLYNRCASREIENINKEDLTVYLTLVKALRNFDISSLVAMRHLNTKLGEILSRWGFFAQINHGNLPTDEDIDFLISSLKDIDLRK